MKFSIIQWLALHAFNENVQSSSSGNVLNNQHIEKHNKKNYIQKQTYLKKVKLFFSISIFLEKIHNTFQT